MTFLSLLQPLACADMIMETGSASLTGQVAAFGEGLIVDIPSDFAGHPRRLAPVARRTWR